MSSSTPGAPIEPERPAAGRARSGRLVLLGLLALFVVPILVAYALNVLTPQWRPFGSTNRGELIEPARLIASAGLTSIDGRPLAGSPFVEQWTLLAVHADGCGDPCAKALQRMRRSRLAMGKDADRVRRVLVVPDGAAGVDWREYW